MRTQVTFHDSSTSTDDLVEKKDASVVAKMQISGDMDRKLKKVIREKENVEIQLQFSMQENIQMTKILNKMKKQFE